MIICLQKIAATVAAASQPDAMEHRCARQVWHMLSMRSWRERWRAAATAGNYPAMDLLDREYEMIKGI